MAKVSELTLMHECGKVFNAAAPINRFQLFKGRKEQLEKVISSISTRGKHVVLFGDRGVGKTSLANILKDALGNRDSIEVVKINCNENDSYVDTWRRALNEITVVAEKPISGNEDATFEPVEYRLSAWLESYPNLGSGEIKRILGDKCSEEHDLVIIFDEADRLKPEQRGLFADTIKDLSDSSTNATIMLIGVAHTITDLIEEHQSVERCISQIFMPPMAKHELREIIVTGLRSLNMTIDPRVTDVIISLSRGYPYYTHLLCHEAAMKAIKTKGSKIVLADLGDAIRMALANVAASVREDYSKAADGQRKGTKYPLIMLSVALTAADDMGYFRPTDLKTPNGYVGNPDFSEQLNKLATDESRGLVLERRGTPRKYKFRFRNPLLRPYIIMKGINDGDVGGGLLEHMQAIKKPEQGTLFDDFE
jgi:Cdc6-like AAA superfamily ATPase